MLKVTPGPARQAAQDENVKVEPGTGERCCCGIQGMPRALTWQDDAAQRPGGGLLLREDHQPLPVPIRHPHHCALPDRLPFGVVVTAHKHVHALRGQLLLLLLLLARHLCDHKPACMARVCANRCAARAAVPRSPPPGARRPTRPRPPTPPAPRAPPPPSRPPEAAPRRSLLVNLGGRGAARRQLAVAGREFALNLQIAGGVKLRCNRARRAAQL